MHQPKDRDDFHEHLDVDNRCNILLMAPSPIPRGLLVTLLVVALVVVGGVAGGIALLVHWLLR